MGIDGAPAVRKERQYARDCPVFRDSSETDVGGVGKRHHHRHGLTTEAQQIELLKGRAERTNTDVLYSPDPLVGVDHFIANLKCHHTVTLTTTDVKCCGF